MSAKRSPRALKSLIVSRQGVVASGPGDEHDARPNRRDQRDCIGLFTVGPSFGSGCTESAGGSRQTGTGPCQAGPRKTCSSCREAGSSSFASGCTRPPAGGAPAAGAPAPAPEPPASARCRAARRSGPACSRASTNAGRARSCAASSRGSRRRSRPQLIPSPTCRRPRTTPKAETAGTTASSFPAFADAYYSMNYNFPKPQSGKNVPARLRFHERLCAVVGRRERQLPG